jgi:hypothetical protein
VATPLATGLHLVDSPVFDRDGNLYVTFSGSRGQQAPISVFVVRPTAPASRSPPTSPIPTSMAFDREGTLYVSSRFDGSVHGSRRRRPLDLRQRSRRRRAASPSVRTMRCMSGIDRARSSGSKEDGRRCVASIPAVSRPSISPSARRPLYVTAPTLAARDPCTACR